MTRLIVEEGGKRRGFKVGNGKLSIGSGEGAKLRLQSPDVAALHGHLEIDDGVAVLTPEPGVAAVKVRGVAKSGPVKLEHGVGVQVGSATLTIEYDDRPARPAAGAVAKPRRQAAASAARGSASRRRRSRDEDEDEDDRSARRPKKQGTPTALIVLPVLGILLLVGFFVMKFVIGGDLRATSSTETLAYYNNAEAYLKSGSLEQAQFELDRISDAAPASDELRARVAQLRVDLNREFEARAEADHNRLGSEYFNTQLQKYSADYLSGALDKPKARVFVQRLRYFKERWPTHEEVLWVDRQLERYSVLVDADAPPTFEDLEWEAHVLTWAEPRDWGRCLDIIQRYVDTTDDDAGREKARQLLETKKEERVLWFDDKMEQARWEWDQNSAQSRGKSARWLVRILRNSGDPAMEDEAGRRLAAFAEALNNPDEMAALFRGYKNQEPDSFAAMMSNPTLAKQIRELGVVE